MTLKNKYQEINERIRLEETQKDDIVNALMAYDVKPKRKNWKWVSVFALVVLVGIFVGPQLFQRKASAPSVASTVNEMESVAEESAVTTQEDTGFGFVAPFDLIEQSEIYEEDGKEIIHLVGTDNEVKFIRSDTQPTGTVLREVQLNQESIQILQEGQEAYWRQSDGRYAYVILQNPMDEDEFIDYIERILY